MRMLRALLQTFLALTALAVGGALLAKRNLRRIDHPEAGEVSIVSVFEGNELRNVSQAFRGGEVWTIYGGTRLDLRRAQVDAVAHLRVTTVFGGTEITVPDGWLVTVVGPTWAGGVDLAVPEAASLPHGAPRLMIEARTLFGGLRVVARPVIKAADAS